jgi:hypothetical protein
MLYLHGQYHWLPKRVAFRYDYCLGCDALSRAIQIRTLDVWHFFWIPLIPLGFWKRWRCTRCGRSPANNPRSHRKFLKAIALLAAAFGAVFWLMPVDQDQAAMWWFFRIGGIALPVILMVVLSQTRADPTTRERLAKVPPAMDTICPICEVQLVPMTWKCLNCGIGRV